MKVLPDPPSVPPTLTNDQKLAVVLSTIDQRNQAASGAMLNSYNNARRLVYGNPDFTSNQIYAAVEAAQAGASAKLGRMARMAKTALLDSADPTDQRMITLAADGVPVFKILDPLNPPANLSDAAQAAFAEIAAAL